MVEPSLVESNALASGNTHIHTHTQTNTTVHYTYKRLSRYQSVAEYTTRANVPILVRMAGLGTRTRNDVECDECGGGR